jgi:hypothetical protein
MHLLVIPKHRTKCTVRKFKKIVILIVVLQQWLGNRAWMLRYCALPALLTVCFVGIFVTGSWEPCVGSVEAENIK